MLPSDEQSVTDVTDIGGLHRKDLHTGARNWRAAEQR
jgi:hypothetical protein